MPKYRVDVINYMYDWVDIGPGPRIRGSITGLSAACTINTFSSIRKAIREAKELFDVRECGCNKWDFVIISKEVNGRFKPGKVIFKYNKSSWRPAKNLEWKWTGYYEHPILVLMDQGFPAIYLSRNHLFDYSEKTKVQELFELGAYLSKSCYQPLIEKYLREYQSYNWLSQ